jgi:hypothetical protein
MDEVEIFFFGNFQILGPLGCQGWVVIPQNVKKSQNHCTLLYMPCVICVPACPAALLAGRQVGPKVSTPPTPSQQTKRKP